jgi:hypothetical protein
MPLYSIIPAYYTPDKSLNLSLELGFYRFSGFVNLGSNLKTFVLRVSVSWEKFQGFLRFS